MARVYLNVAELMVSPLYLGISQYLSQLPAGGVDLLLMRASERADRFCKRRLQAPGSSTLTANASSGATSISVASTLTLDNLSEQAVRLNPGGGNEETITIAAGGVTLTNNPIVAMPYPGTITLESPLAFAHSSGEIVQYVYKEVQEAGSASSSDPYTESLQTQAAQLALAHLPPMHTSLTRVVFLKNYPLTTSNSLINVEHAYSFDNQYMEVDMTGITEFSAEGWYRLRIGQVVIPQGAVRTTYVGGFQTIPDDVKDAVALYFAEMVSLAVNPFFLQQLTMGKRTQRWDTSKGKTFLAQQAEDILKRYKKTV